MQTYIVVFDCFVKRFATPANSDGNDALETELETTDDKEISLQVQDDELAS